MNDLISNKIQIETETVSTKDGKRTYSITRRIVGMDESSAVMVMLYPTRSALKMNADDSTFFHLTQHLPEMGRVVFCLVNKYYTVSGKRTAQTKMFLRIIFSESADQLGVPDTPRVVGRGGATERTSRIKPDTATKRSARRRGQKVLLRRRGR